MVLMWRPGTDHRPTGACRVDYPEDLGIELSSIPSRAGAYLHRDLASHQHRQIQLPRHCFSGAKSMRNRVDREDSLIADGCQHPKTIVDPTGHGRNIAPRGLESAGIQ